MNREESGSHTQVGSIVGTGAAINISCGFVPRYVKVFNPNDAGSLFATMERFAGMAAASGLKTQKVVDSGATGLASSAYVTTNGISDYAGDAGMVDLTGTVTVTANGTTITGSGSKFLTELKAGDVVIVNGQTRRINAAPTLDTAATVDLAFDTAASGKVITRVNGRDPGFTIGADADINAAGEAVFYLASR